MDDGGNVGIGIFVLLIGMVFMIVGGVILGFSSEIKTEKGSIEEFIMNVPNEFGIGLVIMGLIFFIAGILILSGIV
jgi:hypothetical protein